MPDEIQPKVIQPEDQVSGGDNRARGEADADERAPPPAGCEICPERKWPELEPSGESDEHACSGVLPAHVRPRGGRQSHHAYHLEFALDDRLQQRKPEKRGRSGNGQAMRERQAWCQGTGQSREHDRQHQRQRAVDAKQNQRDHTPRRGGHQQR